MRLNVFALVTSLLLGFSSQAYIRIGNGGGGVECGTAAVELLDYHEVRLHGGKVELSEAASLEENVEILLSRAQKIAPQRALFYRLRAHEFMNQARFLLSLEKWGTVEDQVRARLAPGCSLHLAALNLFRRGSVSASDFLVNEGFWVRMSSVDRAGLVLHEAISSDMAVRQSGLFYELSTSFCVRALNAALAENVSVSFDSLMKQCR